MAAIVITGGGTDTILITVNIRCVLRRQMKSGKLRWAHLTTPPSPQRYLFIPAVRGGAREGGVGKRIVSRDPASAFTRIRYNAGNSELKYSCCETSIRAPFTRVNSIILSVASVILYSPGINFI